MRNTTWHPVPDLVTVPYIEGEPAGTATRCGAAWLGETLYVRHGSSAQVAKEVAAELGRAFERIDIRDGIKLCFARSTEFIRDYFAENFDLVPEWQAEVDDPVVTSAQTEAAPTMGDPRRDDALEMVSTQEMGSGDTEEPDAWAQEEDPVSEGDSGLGGDDDSEPEGSSDQSQEGQGHTRRAPAAPPLINRFASAAGFRESGEGRFVHADGRLLLRAEDGLFPWQMLDKQGDVLYWYLPRDVCPMVRPVQLETQHWWLLKEQPTQRVLLVRDREGGLLSYTGESLLELEEQGRVRLHPASYRIEWLEDVSGPQD